MEDPEDNPFHRMVGPWKRVIEDMDATAEQYLNAGWTTVELHPGDVTVLTAEPRTVADREEGVDPDPQDVGLDVLVPGEEYARLREHVTERTFDSYEVFRAIDAGFVFALLVLESADGDVAVFVPVYYELSELDDLRAVADEHGLYTHVRRLDVDEVVTFTHEDPEPFFPDEEEREDPEKDGGDSSEE